MKEVVLMFKETSGFSRPSGRYYFGPKLLKYQLHSANLDCTMGRVRSGFGMRNPTAW